MSWKDWLYINKSDKVAIICLLILLFVLLAIAFYSHKSAEFAEYKYEAPEDYKKWQSQLSIQKENENKERELTYLKGYGAFQPKLKLGETIELNLVDTTQLKMIPSIGSAYANRIVKYRNALGGFHSLEQLNEVWGIDASMFLEITPYLTLGNKHDSLYINTDKASRLLKHPYLNYKQVEVIIDIRERKGDIKSIRRLSLLDEFSKRDMEKLHPYLSFKTQTD